MFPHVNISKQFQAPYDAVLGLAKATEEAAEAAGVSKIVAELVKVRVSQINGCGFCLRMHTEDAVKNGETAVRLAVLPAWWETQYFTAEEQAALVVAERVTRIGDDHWLPAPSVDVEAALSEQQIAAITWLAIEINTWNRIAITSHYPVAP